jgi:hypothetical protein
VIGKLGLGKFGGRQARFRQAPFAELADRNSASPVYSQTSSFLSPHKAGKAVFNGFEKTTFN